VAGDDLVDFVVKLDHFFQHSFGDCGAELVRTVKSLVHSGRMCVVQWNDHSHCLFLDQFHFFPYLSYIKNYVFEQVRLLNVLYQHFLVFHKLFVHLCAVVFGLLIQRLIFAFDVVDQLTQLQHVVHQDFE
jgi:hypothetical protein